MIEASSQANDSLRQSDLTVRRPLKIVGIISFMNAAGAPDALLRLARQLRLRGHEVQVWFIYQKLDIYRSEPNTKVFVEKESLSALEYVISYFRIVAELRAIKPDVVVGFLPLGNVFGLSAAALAGVKNRIASQRSPGNTFGRVIRLIDRWFGSVGIYTSIVCVSTAVKHSFSNYPRSYKRLLRVVHNGIEWTGSPHTKAECRRRLGLPDDVFLYSAVGRIDVQKNYEFLVRGFAHTESGLLAIAGDGALRQTLEVLIGELGLQNRVRFFGALERNDLRDLLRATDVFVQASLFEGQSNAVLEAMHEGLPMLLSDIPEQRETAFDEQTGEAAADFAPLDDSTEWGRRLTLLQSDAAHRAQLSKGAKSMVERRFALSRMIDGFETAMNS